MNVQKLLSSGGGKMEQWAQDDGTFSRNLLPRGIQYLVLDRDQLIDLGSPNSEPWL